MIVVGIDGVMIMKFVESLGIKLTIGCHTSSNSRLAAFSVYFFLFLSFLSLKSVFFSFRFLRGIVLILRFL